MLKLRTPIPPLSAADGWLNGGPVTRERLAGWPVLVHFWAIGCGLCKEQLPSVLRWRRELEPRGLRLLGVHTPVDATPPHTSVRDVAREARQLGLTHPIAVDLTGRLAWEFQVTSTPSYFVFDATGLLRHFHAGSSAEAPVQSALERVIGALEQAHPEAN